MTKKINRYQVSEISNIRIRVKGTSRTIEISSVSDLSKDELAKIFPIKDEDLIANFLNSLEALKKSVHAEIELDFEEPLDR